MRTTRRTILKGGVAVALSAHTAIASGEVPSGIDGETPSVLQALIAEYAKIDVATEEAMAVEAAILRAPGAPAWPTVFAKEFGDHHWPTMRQREYYTPASIEAVFDAEDGRINQWLKFFSVDDEGNECPPCASNLAIRDSRLARNDQDRKATLALYAERQATWDKWAAASGYAYAEQRSSELDDARQALNEKVLAYKVSTPDDVIRKANFIQEHYCGQMHAGLAANLVKEIAEIWSAKI